MKRFACLLLSPLLIYSAGTSAGADDDRVSSLAGSWTCATSALNTAKKTFTQNADGSLATHSVVVGGGGAIGVIDETYHVDANGAWHADTKPSGPFPFGRFSGTAKPWTDATWTFEGRELLLRGSVMVDTPVHMVYTDHFPDAFEREFQTYDGSQWSAVSQEVCTRDLAGTRR